MGDDDEEVAEGAAMNVTKYPVMPSLVSLQQMRNRLHLAFLGRKLMKWTAMATGKELRRLSQEIGKFLTGYREEVREAYMSLARARYFIDDLNYIVMESVPPRAIITVKSTGRSVSGVKVRNLNIVEIGTNGYQYVGLSKGGMAVKTAREAWLALLKKMVYICQLRITFDMIDVAHKNATKKQNVLQRNIIPRILITMRYILSELDEQEREESFRLKRFKQLKYKDTGKKKQKVEPLPPTPAVFVPPPPAPPRRPPPPPPPPKLPAPPPPIKVKIATIIEPPKAIEPLIEMESSKAAELPSDPLEILTIYIMKGIKIVEEVKKAEIPAQVSGLTHCDLARLKSELYEVIRRRQAPEKEKIDTSCACPMSKEPSLPSTDLEKRDGFEAAQKLMPKFKVETKIPDYILKPQPTAADPEISNEDQLQLLTNNVDHVICMTNFYQGEGLLSKSAEDFIKCCQTVKTKIQEYRLQRTVKDKLDALKQQVIKLEKITDSVQNDELPPTAIKSFKACCKEFMDKIERRKSCKGAPSVHSIQKLINQIGDSIALSNEAKKEGLVSESVEEFIASCKEIQSKIQPQDETKPRVIDELLFNINDITEFISKYKDDGLMSASIEEFYETCKITKGKLESYKPPSATPCTKSTCNKTKSSKSLIPKTTTKPVCTESTCTQKNANQVSQPCCKIKSLQDSKPPSINSICKESTCGYSNTNQESERSYKSKSFQDSKPPSINSICKESTCGYSNTNQESERSYKSKSFQDSKPPSINSICKESTCGYSNTNQESERSYKSKSFQDSKPSCIDSICTASTCNYSTEKQESQRSYTSTCNQSTCSESTGANNIEKPKPPRVCKSPTPKNSKLKCTEFTCPHTLSKKESQSSKKSQSLQDHQSTCVCIHKRTKPRSRHPYKSDCCLVSAQEHAKPNWSQCSTPLRPSKHSCKSCSIIASPTEGKNNDPTGGKCSKCTTPKKSNHNSCVSCTSRSQSNISLQIFPLIKGKNIHNPKGHKSGSTCGVSDTNKGSCCDLSAARSKSGASSTVSVPIAGQGRKECHEKTVGKLKTVRRYKEKDGSVIEEIEKVIVKRRIYAPDEVHSQTSSYATGSCESVQSTKTVNVCEVPVRGFIQTVRNVKSETLIRSLNLSHSYPPLAWSCVSVDSVVYGGGSKGNKTVQQDPFFCGSPTTSDDDSESVLHM